MSRISKMIIGLVLAFSTVVFASYYPTNLDTKLPPDQVSYQSDRPTAVEQLFENDTFIYYFSDERDVLSIYDKRNGYTWKSGLDIAAARDVRAALRKDQPLGFEPLEEKMNQTFTGIANSLISVEYYDDSNNIKRLASAGEGVSSELIAVKGEDNHFILEISYEKVALELAVHLYFTEQGYDLTIYDQEIKGEDKGILAAIILNPFLGASGGRYRLYDPKTGKHGDRTDKAKIPGYVLVPDGSGALIRFNDYMVSLKAYQGHVYGVNLAKETYHRVEQIESFKPFKEPLMPVYGIAHGDRQAAFIGYATSGDQHMEIIVMPEENTTLYTWAYPRFVYNNLYYQIFNQQGDGYFTLFDQPNSFDIEFSYNFLAGSGETGYPADYVGMALSYREHLFQSGVLAASRKGYDDIPLRLDFIMSDQKKSVLGYENVVTTSASDLKQILKQFNGMNINVGLYGWQDGGVTTAKPWATDFAGAIGARSEFIDLLKTAGEQGIELSFATDYVKINQKQVGYHGNAARHINNWYLQRILLGDVPFTEFAYARPAKSVNWLNKQTAALKNLDVTSHTIEGISRILLSEHGRHPMTEQETIQLYQASLAELSRDLTLNLKTPNQYLWPYTDRFLQSPVYPTQFLIETDTVPFLQLVLKGTMEIYGPYANFSFAGARDILRMIDYNIYPAFVLTKEASYWLSTTNSLHIFSSEYEQYQQLIRQVYQEVNGALSQVINTDWINREVVAPGVIVNSYQDNTKIVINYTEESYQYNGGSIAPLSYQVIKEEGKDE